MAVSRDTLPALSMADDGEGALFGPEESEGGPAGPGGDSNPLGPPPPYREEHTPGGTRFKELLARANGQGAPPPPPPPSAKPRRALPPEGAPDYDDDNQWEEQAIGSPDVPDPPLRENMPGLDLGPELDYGGGGEAGASGSGGSRFSRMMNQARQNDDRQEAGMAPRASPRSPQEVAKRAAAAQAPVSKEEKERAIKAAVERQQKMMAKARGIDLDDPTLEGAELARKKALSRAQAEAQAGGYVPSSSAADDYLNSLKADSQKKQKETQAKLRGEPLPPREGPLLSASPPTETATSDVPDKSAAPLSSGEDYERVKPQKRTAASWSIQNKADQYMASLKGIKVELADDNPYLKESLVEEPRQPVRRPPPPPPKPPLGPQMSYAEKMKLAKGAKAAGTATAAAPSSNVVAAPVATLPPATEAPPPPAPSSGSPALSYAEKLKQAQAQKAAAGNGVFPKSVPPPPPPPPPTAAAAAVAPASRRLLEQDMPSGGLVDEGDSQAKMVKLMDLLTEHKTAGLEGEDRVSELRHSLVDAREALRAETYGRSAAAAAAPTAATVSSKPMPPPPPPPPQPAAAAAPSPPSPQQQQQSAPPAPPTTSPEDAAILRRCSALLQAHVHSGLAGQDLQALVEGLASSLTIVTAQVVTGTAAAAAAAGGGASGAPPAAAGGDDTGVPAYAGGIQSVGGALSDMGVAKKPASFLPEEGEGDGSAGWTGGSLGEEEKAAASKALGYLLKHRGGKGYGRGKMTGAQAEAMVAALAEVTEIMEEEMVEE
ncbi:hypothetical protein Esi_0455_0006 [Ectocarpus siliculosus]|uniref:Uncharacterized protein n=1 Tax=Ectocarpus siliculosus TaxID=2880 RepID=D7G1P7_ECTSI|nr:hypothetical protein Esi_0455_0006 [Ectocarpus siliculosus]|eukprot:CBJ33292.1 hypothetical protein Esi_0455_0006 [Ectocarpus siliculosus]